MVTRVKDAYANTFGYQATIPDGTFNQDGSQHFIPNPETKNQFVQKQIAKWIKRIVVEYESKTAAETARTTSTMTAETDIVIT